MTRKNVTITLKSFQTVEEINKTMEKMLWDSEYSYQFEDADWDIYEKTFHNKKKQWTKIK